MSRDHIHTWSRSPHPERSILHRFALGLLPTADMERVERHLRACDLCVQTALSAPPDRLVGLLSTADGAVPPSTPEPKGVAPTGRKLLFLAIVACLVPSPGCSPDGVGSVDWSDDAKLNNLGAPPRKPVASPSPAKKSRGQQKPGEYLPG